MNTIFKRVISGAAALGIAVSGLAIGVSTAYAADPVTGAAAPEAQGTITIKGDAHDFSGYKLGSLESITYKTKNDTTSMSGFTMTTNSTYASDIVEVLNGIEDSASTTNPKAKLGTEYTADTAYTGNPIGWLANKYGSTSETTAPWGGSTTGADSELRQFATKLAVKLKNKTADAPGLKSSAIGTENTVAQGLWLLRDTTTLTSKQETASIPIIVSSTYKIQIGTPAKEVILNDDGIGSIDLKNTKPEVGKQVVKGDANKGYTSETVPDYNIGDTVPYELSATLPYYTGYDNDVNYGTPQADAKKSRQFKILDTASAGLTVTADDVESVKVLPLKNGTYDATKAVPLTKDADYTVSAESVEYGAGDVGAAHTDTTKNTATKITVDLGKYVNLVSGSTSAKTQAGATAPNGILEGGKVVVILKAKLNKNAKISDPGATKPNPNKVALEYSNNPENLENKHTTPGDEVNVYTYQFKIKKTDKGGKYDADLLTAEFKVEGPKGWLKAYNETTGWTFAMNESAGMVFKPETVVTGGTTEAIIKGLVGLDSGEYTVKETKAPDNYSSLSLPEFKFKITPTKEANSTKTPAQDPNTKNPWGEKTWGDYIIGDVTFSTATGNGSGFVTANPSTTGEAQYTVYNAKNITELPKTGGAGLAMIVAVGALFIAASGIFALRARRKA